MLTVLHGDHHVNSRTRLVSLLETAIKTGLQTQHFESNQMTPALFESEFGSQNMFGNQKIFVIENVFAGPKSKKKDTLIELINTYSESQSIIVWESKKLTAANLKKLPKAKVELFELSSALFAWLDALHQQTPKKLQLLQTAVGQDGAEFCFAMLARQVRLLLQTKSGSPPKAHPFVIKKLQQQARAFSTDQLIALQEKLTLIDYHLKTGQAKLSLAQELESVIINSY